MTDSIKRLRELREEFEKLNRTFTTKNEIKIDVSKIKKQITEDLKRELQGRSSYGIGI